MLRFRLRTFLVAITLFCLLLGWRISAVESVERPIRELEKLGWNMDYHNSSRSSVGNWNKLDPNPPKAYWRKLLFGYRKDDLPYYAWLGSQSDVDTAGELQDSIQQAVDSIQHLPSLVWVDISEVPLNSNYLATLASCDSVRTLNLESTGLDDTAIDHLAKLTQLETLTIWDTRLTAEGLADLERRLPNCQIEHDFNDD